ncbi:NosR/NirI family transcriptional regulator, nitrous oxide reductase regulator [Jhaorihella thermophila]|uniref:NosR/NirI family transcriptional regulator, nitrous oxide reductase regulator n=1 Tax=Jhaorihella thermophila TaxID=488547 RepID=A0A1H5YE41_9RHOB|nr:NosR/NirI family transcriptional regulator, nitrous oxide reductase regulator [Jhaorihella thermophila]
MGMKASSSSVCRAFRASLTILVLALLLGTGATRALAGNVLERFLPEVAASDLVPGATGYGAIREDMPVAPVLKNGERIAWAYITTDFVSTIGYSGKPIHVLVAVDDDATIVGAELVEQSEPIILIGIPNSEMVELTEGYVGTDLAREATERGTAHELEIISGATVTVMVMDDSILRSGVKVARALGLGGLPRPRTPARRSRSPPKPRWPPTG